MSNKIILKKKIKNFNKKIFVPGDKSLSIRWVLISSLSSGVSKAQNLLMSEDVMAAIKIEFMYNNILHSFIRRGKTDYR